TVRDEIEFAVHQNAERRFEKNRIARFDDSQLLGTTKVLAQRYSNHALWAHAVLHADQAAVVKVEPVDSKKRLTRYWTKVRDLLSAHVYVEQSGRVVSHE